MFAILGVSIASTRAFADGCKLGKMAEFREDGSIRQGRISAIAYVAVSAVHTQVARTGARLA